MTTARQHPTWNTRDTGEPPARGTRGESADRPSEAYRATLGSVTRPAGLDDRVLAAMHAERARVADERAGRVERTARERLSRRRFVALGASAAVVAGLGVLGIGLPPAGRRTSIDGSDPGGTPDTPGSTPLDAGSGIGAIAGTPLFGLAVATAAEVEAGTRTFTLEPTSRGIMVAVTARGTVDLALNYEVVGEELELVEYALENVPTITEYYEVGGYVEQPIAQFEECMLSWTRWDINGGFSEMRTFLSAGYVRERSDELDGALLAQSGPVSQGHSSEGASGFSLDGTEATEARTNTDNATYQVLRVWQTDDFWASDPVLVAYQAHEDERVREFERTSKELTADGVTYRIASQPSEELAQAQFAFWQAFSEVYSDRDTFVAWMRPLYVTALKLAAQTLGGITLAIRGTFADGSTATRRYRLGLVDGYEQVAQSRFDALLGACGLTMDEDGTYYANGSRYSISDDQLPFFDFVAGLPPDDTDDPRLQAPLFTITDVTDERALTQR